MQVEFLLSITDVLTDEKKFSVDLFEGIESTYEAIESTIVAIRANKNIKSHKNDNIEYLYNDKTETAILLKCAAKLPVKQFNKRKIKRTTNENDYAKRDTTTLRVRNAILHFMNHKDFKNYGIVVSVGTITHDSCVFFRKYETHIEAIYFNPNYSDIQEGVQSSKLVNGLLSSFHTVIRRIRSYYSPDGNIDGLCSGLTWKQMFSYVWEGLSPFDEHVHLDDYSHLTTLQSHKRYHSKEKSNLKHYSVWKTLDDVLKNVPDAMLITISTKMSHIIYSYYQDKNIT